eukprot:3595776-Pyramimonas_sp.AAC.1
MFQKYVAWAPERRGAPSWAGLLELRRARARANALIAPPRSLAPAVARAYRGRADIALSSCPVARPPALAL